MIVLVCVFTIILEQVLSTYNKVCCKTIFCVMMAAASCMLCLLSLLIVSLSLMLDLISCYFVQ